MPYKIIIADNFHYMDEDAQYEEGEYAKAEEAIMIWHRQQIRMRR